MSPPVAAGRGTLRLAVRHVLIDERSGAGVAYVMDQRGGECAIAVKAPLARHLRSALANGETPMIEADAAAILRGFPNYPSAGQGVAEYGLLVSLIAVLCIAALVLLSGDVNALLSAIGAQL
jgi:Flp pilus assembly pilin Flp